MNTQINWKSRYAELLDSQEKQQQRYLKKNNLLSNALTNMSALARGMDQGADDRLLAVQGLLRREKLKNVDLEPAVVALAGQTRKSLEIRQKNLSQVMSDVKKLSAQVRSISPDAATVQALKQLEKSLAEKSREFKELPLLLKQLVMLHKRAIKEGQQGAGASLWDRLFSTKAETAAPASETSEPETTASDTTLQPESVDAESAEKAIAVKPEVKPEVKPDREALKPAADANDRREYTSDSNDHDNTELRQALSSSLTPLLHQISPPEVIKDLHESTNELLASRFHTTQIPEIITSVCELVTVTFRTDRAAYEEFLKQLNARLSEANDSLMKSRQMSDDEIDASRSLNDSMRARVGQIQTTVSTATDIEQLKMEVSANVEQMVSVMDAHQQQGQLRQQSLSSELNSLVERVRHMEDETQLAEGRIAEQRRIAMTDALTQLPNREAYNQRGEHELHRWERYKFPFCLVVCDIDFFKRVNDDYGHACGDEVLKGVASIIQKRVRDSDFVSRFGGEEFVVLLPETAKDQAFNLMESVREAVKSHDFTWESQIISVSISIGIANFKGKDNLESAFTRADRALYRAKETGRNKTVMTED